MTIVKVQRTIACKSGQPADAVVNSLYFQVPDILPATFVTLCAKINDLFNTAVGGGNAVRYHMGENAFGVDANSYKIFDMDDPTPRVPIAQPVAQNLTPLITTVNLPSEVACCLSFRGPLVSGQPPGRRRGRIFVGPLNLAAQESDPITGQTRPSASLQTALTAGANKMHDDLVTANIQWVVYSPTMRAGGAAVEGCTVVTYAWVDNAFDTQRRRGQRPTARTFSNV